MVCVVRSELLRGIVRLALAKDGMLKKVALRDESVFDLRLKDSTGTPVNTGEATNTKIFRPPVMQGGTLIDGLTGAEGVSILSDYCTFFAPQDSTIVW